VRFQRKTDHISETVKDKEYVAIVITNKKWHMLFQLDDLYDDLYG